jgi:hypothetical protein
LNGPTALAIFGSGTGFGSGYYVAELSINASAQEDFKLELGYIGTFQQCFVRSSCEIK